MDIIKSKFILTRDINGFNGFGLNPSNYIEEVQLLQSAEQHFTVSSQNKNWLAIFSYDPGLRIFVADNATAAVPTTTFALGHSDLNPTALKVKGGDVLSFITPDTTAFVVVKFYGL
jgi:hypothetical protein